MSRPQRPWFRFYVEAIDDDKLLRHPPTICWLWTVILALARKSPHPGLLLISENTPHTAGSLAAKARVPVKATRAALAEFTTDGMIGRDDERDCWAVTNWKERQYETDNTTERTRKHRSREPDGNVPEPFPTPNGNVPKVFPGTPPETETETDKPPPPPRFTHDPSAASVGGGGIFEQAIKILAQRHLAAARTTVTNPAGWLAAAEKSLAERYRSSAGYAVNTLPQLVPETLANYLEPPPVVKLEARPPTHDDRPACDRCGRSGMVLGDDDVARPCAACNA